MSTTIDVGFWPTVPGPPPSNMERQHLPEKSALMDQDIAAAKAIRDAALREAHDPVWKFDNPEVFAVVLAYLNNPERTKGYRGSASCRICGCGNGSQDWFKGPFRYPQGYVHYLVEHDFKPPQAVIDAAMQAMTDALSRRFAEEQAIKAVPKRLRQRQDALDNQLRTLLAMATRAGCYDAADWLKEAMKSCQKP